MRNGQQCDESPACETGGTGGRPLACGTAHREAAAGVDRVRRGPALVHRSVDGAASTARTRAAAQTTTQVSTLVRLRPSEHSGRAHTKQVAPSCVSLILRWILVCGW